MHDPENPTALAPPDRTSAPAPPVSVEPPEHDADDRSIEEYMTALLERVNSLTSRAAGSEPPAGEPAAPHREAAAPAKEEAPSSAAVLAPSAPPSMVREPPADPALPRTSAPESVQSMASMRELANLHARAAISTHSMRDAVARAYGKLAATVVAMLVAVAVMAVFGVDRPAPFAAAALTILLASLWGAQYLLLARRLLKERISLTGRGAGSQQSQ